MTKPGKTLHCSQISKQTRGDWFIKLPTNGKELEMDKQITWHT